LTTYRAWAQLNLQAKEEWGSVFPDGKIPVRTIPAQKIRFESFKDPESVFSVDWGKLESWQQKALLEKLSHSVLVKAELLKGVFSIGHNNFCRYGTLDVTFGDSLEGLG
jgi:hypothetical protein